MRIVVVSLSQRSPLMETIEVKLSSLLLIVDFNEVVFLPFMLQILISTHWICLLLRISYFLFLLSQCRLLCHSCLRSFQKILFRNYRFLRKLLIFNILDLVLFIFFSNNSSFGSLLRIGSSHLNLCTHWSFSIGRRKSLIWTSHTFIPHHIFS